MEEVRETKQCPICKKDIDKQAQKCPYCQSELSVASNIGTILSVIGGLLIIFVTIPVILFSCGGCGI